MNYVQPIRDLDKLDAIKKYLRLRNLRDWMLFVAGINSGLRISDLLLLRVEDVGGKHIVLKETKTRKRKWIRIVPKLRRAFDSYTPDMNDRDFLFRSREGGNKPISRARAYQVLREAARVHGLDHIGTHTMRKTFGYHFYQQYKDVALLQRIFNHANQSVTLRYIGIDQDAMDQAMSKFGL